MSYPEDLYEFPAEHVGRRCFVSVRGHTRSVPKYKTYKGSDGYNRILPDYGGEYEDIDLSAYIIRDMEPYKSPIDGTMITSRSHHRNHKKQHNVIEVGNERMPSRSRDVHAPLSGRDIADAIKQLGGH